MKKIILLLFVLILVSCNSKVDETTIETNNETIIETNQQETEKETKVETEKENKVESEKETQIESEKETQIESENSNDMMQIALYFVKDNGKDFYLKREIHETPKTEAVARKALELLINAKIKDKDAVRPIPEDTKVLGISINDGIATVDFSKEIKAFNAGHSLEAVSIQAITNTLTEFNTINQVKILVEGKEAGNLWGHVDITDLKLNRNLDSVYEPSIWVTNIKENDLLTNKTSIKGSMSLFENTMNYRLYDENGNIISEHYVNGKLNGLTRADFDFTIDFKTPNSDKGKLQLFAISAKDGSEFGHVDINIRFK